METQTLGAVVILLISHCATESKGVRYEGFNATDSDGKLHVICSSNLILK